MKKAFTLVEMLVAIILLTLLIGIAVFAFKLQLISIHKTKTQGIARVIEYLQLRATLESIKYYVVDDYDTLNRAMKLPHFFFQGDEKTMLFITTNPIYSDQDSLVRLECQEDKLIYTEEKLFASIDYLRPSFTQNQKTAVLYKDISDCIFYYYKEKVKLSKISNDIPTAIGIEFQDSYQQKFKSYTKLKQDNNNTLGKVKGVFFEDE
jgi:prepilin-type N-terminal cleavage/methylation domain-containing protein